LLGFKTPAARWALVTGFLISIYSAVDKVGVRYFDPLIYLYLILFVGWLALTPQWLRADRRAALIAELDRRASIAASALFGIAAYALVLTALRLSPVSYVSPVREVSVVVGAWIGVKFMAEQGGRVRIVASLLVALGILLIAAGG
jgi:uncharacterized membrane protein